MHSYSNSSRILLQCIQLNLQFRISLDWGGFFIVDPFIMYFLLLLCAPLLIILFYLQVRQIWQFIKEFAISCFCGRCVNVVTQVQSEKLKLKYVQDRFASMPNFLFMFQSSWGGRLTFASNFLQFLYYIHIQYFVNYSLFYLQDYVEGYPTVRVCAV